MYRVISACVTCQIACVLNQIAGLIHLNICTRIRAQVGVVRINVPESKLMCDCRAVKRIDKMQVQAVLCRHVALVRLMNNSHMQHIS